MDAALAYAEAGWFVLPARPGTKNPGSVVGSGWPEQSTRDADQIREWWGENPDYGIALHSGRSGAVVFDLDTDELTSLPSDLREGLQYGKFQSTRRGENARGHYVFAVPTGESYGNSAGAFASFGDVRGKNGVIIAAPTPHVDSETHGGGYLWGDGGPVPDLPDALRTCLRAAPEHEAEPMTEAELGDFFAKYTENDRLGLLAGVLKVFEQNVNGGMSRHEALVLALPMAYREAVAGCYPAETATAEIQEAFNASFHLTITGGGRSRPAPDEFARTARWAAAQALLADPVETLARLNRDDPARVVVDEEAFWSARPELEQLRQFARSRRVGPWSMFGAVLARAMAVVPPNVVLPPLVGDYGSLNLFVAIAAKSGSGKGTSEKAAKAALLTNPVVHTATPGSGEGILKEYAFKKGREQVDVRNSVLFSVPEIDSLAALKGRSGSTLMSELRKAWMGEQLGFSYAADEKKIPIKDHRYRMSMVVGVQPGRSQTLLDDADGGTPQRFLWFPTTDPDRPRGDLPENPGALKLPRWPGGTLVTNNATVVTPSDDGEDVRISFDGCRMKLSEEPDETDFQVLGVPRSAVEAIDAEVAAKLDGRDTDDLDSHGLLARLKVAAALMWLAGRTEAVTEADWELAGVVKAISDRTRAQVQQTLHAKAGEANRNRGRADGERAVAQADALETAKVDRALHLVRKHVQRAGTLTRKGGRKALRLELREYFDEAADRLIQAGVVERIDGRQGSYSLRWKEAE
ncbi:hypothetical protein A6410_05460 [Prescottella equi]|nr:hypothetical protein A6410_05460 [Prescottella equi]